MKHAEFKKQLSSRLAIKESELQTLLRANRKILKTLVNQDNGFSIPTLGLFKKHSVFKHKEYSHYHGYELLTKLKKILRFYPESFAEKKMLNKKITHSDISDLITCSTGVSTMLSQQFLNETAAIIREGLIRDKKVYVSGVGLFKMSQRENDDNIKELKNDDKVIYFKADAGLRNNILKSNGKALKEYNPTVLKAENSLLAPDKKVDDLKNVTNSFPAMHGSIAKPSAKVPGDYASQTISGRGDGYSGSMFSYKPADKSKLTRETFLLENKDLYLKENHSYFEWAVIAIFLIILAAGIYLIKPSVEPANEFSSQPFEFTEMAEPKAPPVSDTIKPAR